MKAIRSGWLVCSSREVRKNGILFIDGNRIAKIGDEKFLNQLLEEKKLSSEDVLDKRNSIIFPGFVNAHMHQYGILSHGIPQAGKVVDFDTFLRNYWWPYIEDRIRKEQVLVTAKGTMAEMIHSGITSFCDILEAPYTEDDTLTEQGKLIESVGMRAVVSLESSERVDAENGRKCLEQNIRAVDYFHKKAGLVRGAICTHTTFTCSENFIKQAAEYSKNRDCIFQFHLSESRYESDYLRKKTGEKPVALYEKAGALGMNTLATQCVKIDEAEIEILKKYGVQTVHMPISNCEVGGGIAPVVQMLDMGLETALGTDGYMNDFFLVMKEAFLIHKAALESTEVMPAAQVFRMATEYGAKAMGLDDCGLLKEGYKADFVIYENSNPTPVTETNIYDQLVVYGNSNYVTDVWIDGKQIMKNRLIRTMDEKEAMSRVKQCAEDFWRDIR